MSKLLKSFWIFLLFPLSSCGVAPFTNGSFENGTFAEWELTGNAFTLSDQEQYADGTRYYQADGHFHCLGSLEEIGTLKSPNFILSESGYISFLISGSQNLAKTSVSVRLANNNQTIFQTHNEYYDDPEYTESYLRVNADLSSFLGEKAYFLISDVATDDAINVDGFVTDISEENLPDYLDDTNIRFGLSSPSDMREAADVYIQQNAWHIQKENRFAFHLTGEIGWINDPNGFTYYNNQIQLFYQHNPYDTKWGPMHWGHATSSDFVTWNYQNIALAPDQDYDVVGAFSGSAIEWNGKYYIVYTGASPEGQVQCLAVSEDGIHFEKYGNNPVIGANLLPANTTIMDFRDPKLFVRGEYVYLIVSARNALDSYSKLLLYKSKNLVDWQYAGKSFANGASLTSTLGIMLECPDLFTLDEQDVILVSPQTVSGHRNSDGNVYVVGTMDWTTGAMTQFSYDQIEEIDHGFDFYAPTTLEMPDGRRVMVAWMAGWNRTPVTASLGFAGAMTFPRTLSLEEGHLFQWPVAEIEAYRTEPIHQEWSVQSKTAVASMEGKVQDITLEFTPIYGKTGLTIFGDLQGKGIQIYYQDGRVFLDRRGVTENYFSPTESNNVTSCVAPLVDGKVKLRVLVDKYSVEVFVADGYSAMTATGRPDDTQSQVLFYSDNPNRITVDRYAIDL